MAGTLDSAAPRADYQRAYYQQRHEARRAKAKARDYQREYYHRHKGALNAARRSLRAAKQAPKLSQSRLEFYPVPHQTIWTFQPRPKGSIALAVLYGGRA